MPLSRLFLIGLPVERPPARCHARLFHRQPSAGRVAAKRPCRSRSRPRNNHAPGAQVYAVGRRRVGHVDFPIDAVLSVVATSRTATPSRSEPSANEGFVESDAALGAALFAANLVLPSARDGWPDVHRTLWPRAWRQRIVCAPYRAQRRRRTIQRAAVCGV